MVSVAGAGLGAEPDDVTLRVLPMRERTSDSLVSSRTNTHSKSLKCACRHAYAHLLLSHV